MKTHKAITKTSSGEITTWIVVDDSFNFMTFRIVLFKMDEEYAKKNNDGNQTFDLQIEAFDRESFGWKTLIKSNDFSNEELKAMIEGNDILGELKDFLITFFGIRMYNDVNQEEDDELPF